MNTADHFVMGMYRVFFNGFVKLALEVFWDVMKSLSILSSRVLLVCGIIRSLYGANAPVRAPAIHRRRALIDLAFP
jgi:hypothetical protein